VISKVRGWHFGRYPATRTARARENLTEFQPQLLEALSKTAQPDLALATFDRFLSELPAGIQLFAMLRNNPDLLDLLADIMGSAPRMARLVSRRPRLMDVVLDSACLGDLPTSEELNAFVAEQLKQARSYEDCLDRVRQLGQEQSFLIGVRVLSGAISAEDASFAYARLADSLIIALKGHVERMIVAQHGRVPGGEMAVLGMGKLGGMEMTANSDLDLIMIYRYDDVGESSGPKPLSPAQYYSRVTQRLISALSVPTAEGGLYEVDMRLRPSGKSGPVATSLAAFTVYQDQDAWIWEHMALTRARVIASPDALRKDIEASISAVLRQRRSRAKVAADVLDMRGRIAKEKDTGVVWNLKHVRGGLVDIEFIAQFLQLIHGVDYPEILQQNTINALEKSRDAGILAAEDAESLISAANLFNSLGQIMRLCQEGQFDPDKAPSGLKALLSRAVDVQEFSEIETLLQSNQTAVADIFDEIIP
jgi:glutamate-ammonia-ligase adenylyltransferase